MSDWVYPVNEESDNWDGSRTLKEHLRRDGYATDWHLATGFRLMFVGDRIWVYGALPHKRILGVGIVSRGPEPTVEEGSIVYRIDIEWDTAACARLIDAGPKDVLESVPQNVRRLSPRELQRLRRWQGSTGPVPVSLERGRRRRQAEVTERLGQADFRKRLFLAYDERCAITRCSTREVLQAAHIARYDGPATNVASNGLLLRADLHNLFDRGLLWIDDMYVVHVASEVKDAAFTRLSGRSITLPQRSTDRPSKLALRQHRIQFGRQK